ncbi:MAG: DUF4091 domain-containing protein [Ruminococcaceae bacterium]|nr:DUF4091 domain-containing protein [Oscillospiraceae bacterium]
MKKTLKNIAFVFIMAMILCALNVFAFTSSAVIDDPADVYVPQRAEHEDESLDLWFEHSFTKVFTSDTTPSDMDTYSVYMARNEKENAQFVLYSDTDKTGMKATVTSFTNEAGDEIPTTLYYEMYLTVKNIDTGSVLGMTAEDSIIREGEVPDPIVPLANINATGGFKLNGGKSQAFLIQLETAKDTPAGWYSAQLNVQNSAGECVKTATVYCCVWDFEIKDGPTLQTSFLVDNNTTYGGNYTDFYEYMIDNRLMPMDMPGGFYATNPYLTDDRVSAIRVAATGGGYNGIYADKPADYPTYKEYYNDLVNSDYWDEVKDKLYFYTIDEPRAQEVCDRDNKLFRTNTIDGAKYYADLLDSYWPDAQVVIPMYDNHAYPYYTYHQPLENYEPYEIKDAVQELMDTDSVTIWCPMTLGFTPQSELNAYGYPGEGWPKIRSYSGTHSGIWTEGSEGNWTYHDDYFNWENIYGEFSDRTLSHIAVEKEKGNKVQLWGYICGSSRTYTYTNHLPENTGLQTKLMFWQLYQEDCTGYLYYGSNNWNEYDSGNGNYTDNTVTGGFTKLEWKPNLSVGRSNGYDVYGDGVLFYGASQAKIRGITKYVGTIRVEILRDGVEEYEMLTMLEEYKGEKAAKDTVARVSTNIVNYLSLPAFSTAGWDSSMTCDDIMAEVRKDLGFAVEKAVLEGKCDHNYDGGEVILEATCIEMGTLRRTCTDCGAVTDEIIPTLHAVGDCYEVISEIAASCYTDGSQILECTICKNTRTVNTTAFHNDDSYLTYKYTNDENHTVYCNVCEEKLDVVNHDFFEKHTATCTEAGEILDVCVDCGHSVVRGTLDAKGHKLVETTVEATCTEDGYTGSVCKNCDYEETTVLASFGHSFVEGNCTVCGEADPDWSDEPDYIPGDFNVDGELNAMDMNIAKRIIAGTVTPTEIQALAGDLNGDGGVNGLDSNILARMLAGTN